MLHQKRPLRRHPLCHGDVLSNHRRQGRLSSPRSRADDGRDPIGDLIPRPGDVTHMAEGQRRQATVTGLAQHISPSGHGPQCGMIEQRPLGQPRRPGSPDHRHWIARRSRWDWGPHTRWRVDEVREDHDPTIRARKAVAAFLNHAEHGLHPLEDAVSLGHAQAWVDSGRDGPEPNDGLVQDGELDRRG